MSENVTKTKEQDGRKPGEDYRDADGILVCGKCGEPRERMFPAGGIFKEPHLVPTMCRCQREEADRQREEAERAEKRRRTEQHLFANRGFRQCRKRLTRARKGSMGRLAHRPSIKSGLLFRPSRQFRRR